MDVAVMDENGAPRKNSDLNKVFGVDPALDPHCPSTTIPLIYSGDFLGTQVSLAIPKLRVGTSVRLTTGKSAISAKAPIFITNKFGKGEGILFNCQLSAGNNLRDPKTANIAKIWKALAKHCGIKRIAEVRKASDDKSIFELSTFKNGDVVIMGVQRALFHPKENKPVTVAFDKDYDVFNMLDGKHIGRRKSMKINLTGTRAGFYSLFPVSAAAWDAKASSAKIAPGGTLNIVVSGGESANKFEDRYSLAVRKKGVSYDMDPNGGVRTWWQTAVIKHGAESELVIPVAFNEEPGKYLAVVRRDMTGETKGFEFEVVK
jgi:hypothetical protein